MQDKEKLIYGLKIQEIIENNFKAEQDFKYEIESNWEDLKEIPFSSLAFYFNKHRPGSTAFSNNQSYHFYKDRDFTYFVEKEYITERSIGLYANHPSKLYEVPYKIVDDASLDWSMKEWMIRWYINFLRWVNKVSNKRLLKFAGEHLDELIRSVDIYLHEEKQELKKGNQ